MGWRGSAASWERRRWERLPLAIPFFVRGTKASGEEFLDFSAALNLSAGGVLLAMRGDVDQGATVELELPPSLHHAEFPYATSVLHAKVLRSARSRHYFLVGLEFDVPLVSKSGLSNSTAG